MKTWPCVTLVGVGLIGGSIGLALRRRGLCDRVIGAGSRPQTLETALRLGAISEIAADPGEAVRDASLVVIGAPVDHIVELVRQLSPHCRPGTLITDVGSTKQQIVAELADRAAADVAFLGSHPLAGNEKKGPQHATAELFAGRTVVLTPTGDSRPADVELLSAFWVSLGARVISMPAEEHDQALAVTSHLPHLVAAAIAGSTPERYVALTAGGWQDTTRIAAGDPPLWRQIMLANRENLLASLDKLTARLAEWRAALAAEDTAQLEQLLAEAKRIRDTVGN